MLHLPLPPPNCIFLYLVYLRIIKAEDKLWIISILLLLSVYFVKYFVVYLVKFQIFGTY